jgi:glucose-6-phosphate isomerase
MVTDRKAFFKSPDEPMLNPTARAFSELSAYYDQIKDRPIKDLFETDTKRFQRFSTLGGPFLFDWSKTSIDEHALQALINLAQAAEIEAKRDAMFKGERINITEKRSVLHTALRRFDGEPVWVDGRNVTLDIADERKRMLRLAEQIRQGEITGAKGHVFTDVVNIGIGGSDLGPAMTTLALAPYHTGPRLHFVSNVDGSHLYDTLQTLVPEQTLFIVASKTFTTIETMTNARSARQWISDTLGDAAVGDHFMAVSTALEKAAEFPIKPDRIVGFWDWVGGRYSIWSSIGLPLAIAIGKQLFEEFLKGAEQIDLHFRSAPLSENIPVLLALIGIWHRNIAGYSSRALIPYDQRLHRFPAYVQQLDMESNGKRVGKDGIPLKQASGPIVWGEPGTNSQHAFFQLLHQGTDVIPVEFLIAAESHEPMMKEHQDLLIANCLAQSDALMTGRTEKEAELQLLAMGRSPEDAKALAPHRVFPGNRPSITITYPHLTPSVLGGLIAIYEHRVFVEAAIWGLNAFDQWGVELGKELATRFLPVVKGDVEATGLNGSTAGLIEWIRNKARS